MLRGGKRQFGGKIAYAGSIRNRVALLCCHGALGRHLINRFTLGGAPLPSPADTEAWRHTPVWTGNNPKVSISYSQHAQGLKSYLHKAGIFIEKVTQCSVWWCSMPPSWGRGDRGCAHPHLVTHKCTYLAHALHAPPHCRSRTPSACSRHATWTSKASTTRCGVGHSAAGGQITSAGSKCAVPTVCFLRSLA